MGHREGFTLDKAYSGVSLAFGNRPFEFDYFLKQVPNIDYFQELEQQKETEIEGVIFDIDGTLVSPYAEIPQETIDLLKGYQTAGKKVAVYTNSGESPRLQIFRDNSIDVITTPKKKPSRKGFIEACEQIGIEPGKTAMIGNFATTDMPLSKKGEETLFPLNILVESISPSFEEIGSIIKYSRAQVFQALNLLSAWVVKMRNPYIVEQNSFFNKLLLGILEGFR